MITIEKLNIYKEYGGWLDGYLIQKKYSPLLFSGNEWGLIDSLIQDLYLVSKNLASEEFINNLNNTLKANCENKETINELEELQKSLINSKKYDIPK